MASTTTQMTTNAAAAHAGVAISTIRTWCRKGAVAASKLTGRWIIEAASLAHRINLGEKPATPKPAPLTEVKGEVPAVADIEDAARAYEQARTDTNAAARVKRGALKTLDRTPDGEYGAVTVERYESSRLVADLDAIKALLKEHGLGEVPMKTCSPSLTITFAEEVALSTEAEFAYAA
jgi:hypothetical protein